MQRHKIFIATDIQPQKAIIIVLGHRSMVSQLVGVPIHIYPLISPGSSPPKFPPYSHVHGQVVSPCCSCS